MQITLPQIGSFPTDHPNIAWWVAVILGAIFAWRTILPWLKLLPIWSTKFRLRQTILKLEALEHVHRDSFALLVSLTHEFFSTLLEIAYMCIGTAIIVRSPASSWRDVVFYNSVILGSVLVGQSLRLLDFVSSLTPRRYPAEIAKLRQRQEHLSMTSAAIDS